MAYYHGIKAHQAQTSISTPATVKSGITFVVGTSPVQMNGIEKADGSTYTYKNVNQPIMAMSYGEAVSALGYSDDWKKYSLCEVMYTHYKLYSTAPVFFVNVLDPTKHKSAVIATKYPLVEKRVKLTLDVIAESVVVKDYTVGMDYDVFYDGEYLIIEVLPESTIPDTTTELEINFDKVDPSQVTKADIIGGFDVVTKKATGLELIEAVFPKYSIIPDIIICPGWSHDAEVAAVMGAKATSINGILEAKCIIDIDSQTVRHYADVPEWKKANNINSKNQYAVWPMLKLVDKMFHASTQVAGLIAKVDEKNGGCPAESPSNKAMHISSAVLKDGTEVLIDLQQANYLNSQGVATALNFVGGFVLWGNETACYPTNTDVKDYFLCVSRMFGWVTNSLILTYWNKIDSKFTRRLVDSIVDSMNIWLNGLTAEGKLLGGRVEFIADENPISSLMTGKAVFHIYLTPPTPAKEIEFILEYDPSYVAAALTV